MKEVRFPMKNFKRAKQDGERENKRMTLAEVLKSLGVKIFGPPEGGVELETSRAVAKPSFFRLLKSIEDPQLISPSIADIFSEEDFIAFSLFYGIETEYAQALFRGESYIKMIVEGLFVRLKRWNDGFDYLDKHKELKVQIPVGELHLPNLAEAEATYEVTISLEREVALSISIKGLGAGGSITKEISLHSKVPAPPGECIGLVSNAEAEVYRWKNVDSQEIIETLESITPDDAVYGVPWEQYRIKDKPEDICKRQDAYDYLLKRVTEKKLSVNDHYHTISPSAGGNHSYKLGIKSSDIYSAKCNFPVKDIGLETGIEIKSHYTKDVKIEYTLPILYDYIVAFKDAGQQPVNWGAKDLGISAASTT